MKTIWEQSAELARLRRWWCQSSREWTQSRCPIALGDGLVWMDSRSHSPYASQNQNSLRLLGTERPIDFHALDLFWESVRAATMPYFFLYINPSAQSEALESWARDRGFEKQPFPYLVLERQLQIPIGEERAFGGLLCEPTRADLEMVFGAGASSEAIVAHAGMPRFHILGVQLEGKLVATSSVTLHEEAAYLGHMFTDPSYRGRGCQSALIRARLVHARDRNAKRAYAETYPFLETSLNNLLRAGFEAVFERTIYRWSR